MNVVQEVNAMYSAFLKRFAKLDSLKSECDLQEQDILHYIEFEKYDAATGSRLLKKLKEIRMSRRAIKNEWDDLTSVLKRFDNAGLKNYSRPAKTYTYRTVTINSILGDSDT